MKYPWRDADTLCKLYHDEGLSQREIANRLDTDPSVINDWMQRHGIKSRDRTEATQNAVESDAPWTDEDTLRKLYVEERLSQPEIAERLGCSDSTVSNWIRRHGIKRPWQDEDRMRELYAEEQLSQAEIADRLDCGVSTIETWMNRHGITGRENGESVQLSLLPGPAYEVLTDEDELRHLYEKEGLDTYQIADLLNVGSSTVSDYTRRYGITNGQLSGEDHPMWEGGQVHYYGPNWPEQREKRLERDDHQCVVCGVSESEYRDRTGRDLDVHHIRPRREFVDDDGLDHEAANRLDNLITLCRSCHAKWEGIPLKPES
ncbi:helix-turn-helix domain-containing protein [Natrinema thermotolerans]|uniref:Helix-turn-helix domain-containing protein n=1 Tax=Natrinema thermotolerans TaxID=121872 RepID=A0AAF0PBY1_9EURY|nr:helix-turn-helix domain-containing protein [Natrinema thermotolerans]WMT07796.1 helix-turn-helix domain-containing protein [Natrinema thermotolerans]WMT08428.1 helix-turn-helix domain-containing protein [Natrinema thermotolerans]